MKHEINFRVQVSDEYSEDDVILMMLAGLDHCSKVKVLDSKIIH